MKSDDLDQRVQVFRAEYTQDDHGQTLADWQPLGGFLAAWRRDISDAERFAYGGIQSKLITRFRVRSTTFSRTIKHDDRIQSGGVLFEIIGIKLVETRKTFIEITCEWRS